MRKEKHCLVFTLVLMSAALFAQIPNSGFENWTNWGTYDNPDGWSTLNNSTAAQSLFTATKAAPGNPGSFYLKLTSKLIGGAVVPGIAVSGSLDTVSRTPLSGFAFNQRPAYFNGKWQHMIYGSSQGSIVILLSRWDSLLGKRDTIATGSQNLVGMAMSWANFAFAMVYTDSTRYPDSCMIVLRASGNNPTNNDYLWTDNLSFSGTVAVVPPPPPPNPVGLQQTSEAFFKMSVYPVPAKEQLTISLAKDAGELIRLRVIDVCGKLVLEKELEHSTADESQFILSTSSLAKGCYSLQVISPSGTGHHTFVIE